MLTKNDLEKENGLVMVDFFANWCAPCKAIAPILEELSKSKNVKLIKVDVDQNPELASDFNVKGIPTVLFMKNGVLKETHVGAAPKAKLEVLLEGL